MLEASPEANKAPDIISHDASGLLNIGTPVREELQAMYKEVLDNLISDTPVIRQVSELLISSGGKRLRPMVVLLSAAMFGRRDPPVIRLAAAIELIHTATLLHDDVVDASDLRRGQATANYIWGNQASVLVGDFLYSRSFQMMVHVGSLRAMRVMAEATNRIAVGEVRQLMNRDNLTISTDEYLDIIRAKTARLFEAAARLGAVLCERPEEEENALASYGLSLGMAYQLADDALDYSATHDEMGKNPGADLMEGKVTMPLLHALHQDHGGQLRQLLAQRGRDGFNEDQVARIGDHVRVADGLAHTLRLAEEESEKALFCLKDFPASEYLESLKKLPSFIVHRRF